MVSATLHIPSAPRRLDSKACCLNRAHDAHRLAHAVASVAALGTVVDLGCGAGNVAIPILLARPDLHAVGVEVVPDAAASARIQAAQRGVAKRFRVITGDAFGVDLPHARSYVANPPMLPTEPWFSLPTPGGGEALFWAALLRRLAERTEALDIWLHLFDFQGVGSRSGGFPTVEEVAAAQGLEVGYPHRGWRAIGPGSAILAALPALSRLFPAALAKVDGLDVRFADLPRNPDRPVLIRHSVVRLHRARPTTGEIR